MYRVQVCYNEATVDRRSPIFLFLIVKFLWPAVGCEKNTSCMDYKQYAKSTWKNKKMAYGEAILLCCNDICGLGWGQTSLVSQEKMFGILLIMGEE